jgi:hypothetical protein
LSIRIALDDFFLDAGFFLFGNFREFEMLVDLLKVLLDGLVLLINLLNQLLDDCILVSGLGSVIKII